MDLPDLEHLLLQVANRQQDYKFIPPSYLSCSQTYLHPPVDGCQRGYTTKMKKKNPGDVGQLAIFHQSK